MPCPYIGRMSDRENEIISTVSYIQGKVGFREPPFSLQAFFEAFPHYQLEAARLPRGFHGEILVKGEWRLVRYRVESKGPAVRFTIAHEIGHGFLHADEDFVCRISATFRLFGKKPADPVEWEADYFAAELLMPMPMVNRLAQKRLDAESLSAEAKRLARVFGVTVPLMRARLKDLVRMRTFEAKMA